MFVTWVLFPLVLLGVCLGCGLLVERAAGWALPGPLLPSVGLALVIIAASLTTSRPATTGWTVPLVVVLTLAGYALSWRRLRRLRAEAWAVAVALGVFAVCAAPVVLSGQATFLGYFVLNDTATHFDLIDQIFARSHDLSHLQLSSYLETLKIYTGSSYPVGADVAVGAVRGLVGQDIAWVFQPYLAVIISLGGLAVYELLRDVVRSQPLRAACAFIAAQSGLVYAYYLEASIKEVATTWIITVTVALVFATLRERLRLRAVIPLLAAAVAGFDILDVAIVPWLGIPLAVFAVATAWRSRAGMRSLSGTRIVASVAVVAVLLAALAAPLLSHVTNFFNVATAVLTQKNDLGNLAAPLKGWQVMGIWPSGDFRYPPPSHLTLTYVLIGVAITSAVVGALWAIRRRAYPPLLLLAGNGVAAAYLLSRASPYASAKVMMIFSLTAVLIAMLGAVALHDTLGRSAGWCLAVIIGGAVLWTNAVQYHASRVAPRGRFDELASIGARFSGTGPTFVNQAEPYSVHFLRTERPFDTAALATVELRSGVSTTAPRQPYLAWDTDQLNLGFVEFFRLLVVGRSPQVSRPPANFQLAYRGRYYDVWRRTSSPHVLLHVPFGSDEEPAAVPRCRVVKAVAAQAEREHARLAYVSRPLSPSFAATTAAGGVVDDPAEKLTGTIEVKQPGRYGVWLETSVTQSFAVSIGGHRVGTVANQLAPPGLFLRVGTVSLAAGRQPIVIDPGRNRLLPGGGTPQLIGPLMLAPDPDPLTLSQIAPQQAQSLCGTPLDWLEIVR
jgi:hypothetical protein